MRIAVTSLLLLPAGAAFAVSDNESHGIPWDFVFFHAVNLALLIGVLVWFTRRPVLDALRSRALEVRSSIVEAQQAREQAKARLEELEDKLADFEIQVEDLRREVAVQARQEHDLILERAQREAESVKNAASRSIREEVARARRDLQEEAVLLAVELAKGLVRDRVDEEQQARLFRELLDSLEKEAPGADDDAPSVEVHSAI